MLDLLTVQNKHWGETALVLGNGPSLNHFPLYFFQKWPTFGVNFVYLHEYIQPKYYVCVDSVALGEYTDGITQAAGQAEIAFLSQAHAHEPRLHGLYGLPNVCLVDERCRFAGEVVMSGHTVVYVALKLAYYMGFATVLLAGVDHGRGHFCQNYPEMAEAPEPNWVGQEKHFRIAAAAYRRSGRRVVNLSAPSALDEIIGA